MCGFYTSQEYKNLGSLFCYFLEAEIFSFVGRLGLISTLSFSNVWAALIPRTDGQTGPPLVW